MLLRSRETKKEMSNPALREHNNTPGICCYILQLQSCLKIISSRWTWRMLSTESTTATHEGWRSYSSSLLKVDQRSAQKTQFILLMALCCVVTQQRPLTLIHMPTPQERHKNHVPPSLKWWEIFFYKTCCPLFTWMLRPGFSLLSNAFLLGCQ